MIDCVLNLIEDGSCLILGRFLSIANLLDSAIVGFWWLVARRLECALEGLAGLRWRARTSLEGQKGWQGCWNLLV